MLALGCDMSESKTLKEREIEEFLFDVDSIISSGDSVVDVSPPADARELELDNTRKFASPVLELLAKPVQPKDLLRRIMACVPTEPRAV